MRERAEDVDEAEREMLHDKIWRSNGTLRSAHIINTKETMGLLSMVRLGVDMGIIPDMDRRAVNELFILTQPRIFKRSREDLKFRAEGCETRKPDPQKVGRAMKNFILSAKLKMGDDHVQ